MHGIIQSLATWQARLLTGLACMAAVGAAAAAATNPHLTVAARIMIASPLVPAAVTWILATISGGNTAHPHDVRLFERIVGLLSPDERHFLRTHDFGSNFSLGRLPAVRDISHWEGPEYAFLDGKLQKRWGAVKVQIDALCGLIAQTTAPSPGSANLQTVYPRSVDPEDPPRRVILEIKALNDAATAVSKELDAFEPIARRRLFM